jgi:hypothetical protein
MAQFAILLGQPSFDSFLNMSVHGMFRNEEGRVREEPEVPMDPLPLYTPKRTSTESNAPPAYDNLNLQVTDVEDGGNGMQSSSGSTIQQEHEQLEDQANLSVNTHIHDSTSEASVVVVNRS